MSNSEAREELIAEAITPVPGTMDTAGMARGEPGLPMRFTWRGKEYAVAEVLRRWKETGPCHHGSGERYVRKHWFELRTGDGWVMKVYFERQPRSARERLKRWWLHTVVPPEAGKGSGCFPVCPPSVWRVVGKDACPVFLARALKTVMGVPRLQGDCQTGLTTGPAGCYFCGVSGWQTQTWAEKRATWARKFA